MSLEALFCTLNPRILGSLDRNLESAHCCPRPMLPTMSMLAYTFAVLLLLLSSSPSLSIETETTMTIQGPKVCLTSTAVVTKYVNALCVRGDSLYVAGQFNRYSSLSASSFAVVDIPTGEVTFLGEIGARSLLEDTKRDPEGNFLSTIQTMYCPEGEPFIYLGGMFRNITQHFDKGGNAVSMHEVDRIHETREEVSARGRGGSEGVGSITTKVQREHNDEGF